MLNALLPTCRGGGGAYIRYIHFLGALNSAARCPPTKKLVALLNFAIPQVATKHEMITSSGVVATFTGVTDLRNMNLRETWSSVGSVLSAEL